MSKETDKWLNTMTLIGYTDKRGPAWHYREDLQGSENNHYPGAIPVDDVLRHLFNFEVIEAPITYVVKGIVDNAITTFKENGTAYSVIPSQAQRKGMLANDNYFDMGAFKDGYQGHAYGEWLLTNIATLIDDDLGVGSAGLLRNRAQAWVSIEVPENVKTPEGVEFRPNLLGCTSFDGTLATTYKKVVQNIVCDNTLSAGLSEDGQVFKVKHSRYSTLKLSNAREALAIVHSMADDFAEEVARLCEWEVTKKQFSAHLDLTIPMPEDKGRGRTMAENKRSEIISLYNNDNRCAPWHGTAYGVLQTYNTWNHHVKTVKKDVPRFMRNMENVLGDKFAAEDIEILNKLALVTAS